HIAHALPWARAALGRALTDMSGRQWEKHTVFVNSTMQTPVATAMSEGVEEGQAKGGAFPLLPLNTDVGHWSNVKG
ncbi:MAG: hypothetical protein ACKPKO_01515, partial [Candidatus Fonsibacter sp.]